MAKVKYAIIGFGGIAENRIAKEGYACDKSRFAPLQYAELTGAFDLNPARKSAAEALGLKWYDSVDALIADPEIDALVEARTAAKKAKNFAEADRIRDELKARGIEIIDTPQGTKWRKV